MNRSAAIYARVSTDDQAEKGYSLPSQIEACRKFALQKGFDVAGVYQDDISGAKPITTRPYGSELQRAIDMRQINTVIVYCVDRLSRDIVDLLTTVRDWLRTGVEIYCLDVGQIISELDIVLVIKGWQGSDERKKILERTTRGKNEKARAGKVVGGGTPPYGYTYQDGELAINEAQARIVRMIFDWYTNGSENGIMMSQGAIAKRLTELGIPRPSEAKGWKKKRIWASRWDQTVVKWIISSETYCGTLRYGKYIGARGRGGKRPEDEQIPISVPAIIDREKWLIAQERREYNSRFGRRKRKTEYLLRGLLFCGCGRHMVASNGKYYCTRRYRTFGGERCTEPFVHALKVEHISWGYIMRLLTNADEFENALREAQAFEAEQMQPKQKELEHVKALLIDTEYEAVQVAETLKKVKGIVAEKLQAQVDEIDRRYQALQKRKAELESDLQTELSDGTIETLLEFREAVAVGLNNPTPEEKRLWVELLKTRVTVTNQIAVVTCRLSRTAVRFDLFTPIQTSSGFR
jgi:site-specific DNA recombinase